MSGDEIVNVVCKDLSFRVMAAVFEVHDTLGYGFLETVYERALVKELQLRDMKAESQKELKVFYKGEQAVHISPILW